MVLLKFTVIIMGKTKTVTKGVINWVVKKHLNNFNKSGDFWMKITSGSTSKTISSFISALLN